MQRGFITIYREKLSPYLTKVHCLSTAESLRVQLASTARAQHETELQQASGSTSETERRTYSKAKCGILTTARLVVPSWVTATV